MTDSKITSHSNPKIKQIRALAQRKQRTATGLFVVEGIAHMGAALEAEAVVEYICYAPELLTSDFGRQVIEQANARNIATYAVEADVFARIAAKDNPQGLLAVVHQATLQLDALNPENFAWGVALVAPQDPGNVGTILRTLDAVDASGLILLDNSVDLYHPTAVRASLGALFWHPVVMTTFATFAQWAKQHGYTIYGTSAHGHTDYRAVAYTQPAILLMGSEREGLSAAQQTACHELVRLPMAGRVTSLNLSVATGVMLYAMWDTFTNNRTESH